MWLFSTFLSAVYMTFYWHLSQYFNTLFKCPFYAFSTRHLSKALYALNMCFVKNECTSENISNRNPLPCGTTLVLLAPLKMAPRKSMSSIELKIENWRTKTFFRTTYSLESPTEPPSCHYFTSALSVCPTRGRQTEEQWNSHLCALSFRRKWQC